MCSLVSWLITLVCIFYFVFCCNILINIPPVLHEINAGHLFTLSCLTLTTLLVTVAGHTLLMVSGKKVLNLHSLKLMDRRKFAFVTQVQYIVFISLLAAVGNCIMVVLGWTSRKQVLDLYNENRL